MTSLSQSINTTLLVFHKFLFYFQQQIMQQQAALMAAAASQGTAGYISPMTAIAAQMQQANMLTAAAATPNGLTSAALTPTTTGKFYSENIFDWGSTIVFCRSASFRNP